MYPVLDAQWLMYPLDDKGGEENHCHAPSGGRSVTYVPSGRQGGEECLCHVRSGGHSVTYVPSGEENHYHVPSGGHSVTHVPSGRQGGEECLCHVPSGGRSVAYVPSGGRGRRGGSLPCTQWGTLSGLCTQVGDKGGEENVSAMYPVGDAHWLMYQWGTGDTCP